MGPVQPATTRRPSEEISLTLRLRPAASVRNLERAGIARSAAMKVVGHRTESIYRRYSIVDAKVLEEAAVKLAMLQASDVTETLKAATESP